MSVKVVIAIFFLLSVFVSPSIAQAVTITIDQIPQVVTSEPFTVNVSVLGASQGQNYLRADLYKDGTSGYFGETYNGTDWYNGSSGTAYLPITVLDSKTAVQTPMQIRIGTPSLPDYSGSGNYKLKIRRYTSSGNAASSDQQTPADITIQYELPTPTPTQVPEPTATNAPTPTKTPTPTKIPTPTKTPTPVKSSPTVKVPTTKVLAAKTSIANKLTPTISHGPVPTAVLNGQAKKISPPPQEEKVSPTPYVKVLGFSGVNPAIIFIAAGLLIICGGGVLLYLNYKKESSL